jgi:iron(III) transport system substrate-binding protein
MPTHPLPTRKSPRIAVAVVAALLFGIAGLAYFSGAIGSRPVLTVYCAHDSVYSEPILREFERRTGIPLSIRFDTEATKSLGLVELLMRERAKPRCDVFWNNELLGTLDLARAGALEPYKGTGYERIPAGFKDPEGRWTGMAARMRVYIVNTEKMPATDEALAKALEGNLARMAVAKPLYGTTRTHYTVLWREWGGERLKTWHREVRGRGLKEVGGNATVKNLVADGACDFGWTDTDDFFVGKDEGKPVEMLPVRVGKGSTISIPNTISIIRGTARPAEARKLADFLLSAETELALAKSSSRQVPLGQVNEDSLPDDVRRLRPWAKDGYDLTQLEKAADECLEWLKSEYVP